MQIAKDNNREAILEAAMQEFLLHGFKEASMRAIAERSGVSLGNIYTYFRSKDEIFCVIVQPVIARFKQQFVECHDEESFSLDVFFSESYQREMIMMVFSFVKVHKRMLDLLLFRSQGSSLEHYREQITALYMEKSAEYMAAMKEKYPHVHSDISTLFIQAAGKWWICIMELIVRSESSAEETAHFISDYIRFGTAGWKALMHI